jgi:hypothetical protein
MSVGRSGKRGARRGERPSAILILSRRRSTTSGRAAGSSLRRSRGASFSMLSGACRAAIIDALKAAFGLDQAEVIIRKRRTLSIRGRIFVRELLRATL